PNYIKNSKGNLVFSHYTASKDGYIAFIIAASQLGSFESNIATYQSAFDLYYSSGQPSKGQIAWMAGDAWKGIGMMWHDAIRSLEWWAGTIAALGSSIPSGLQLNSSVSKIMGSSYLAAGEVTVPIKNTELLNQLNATSKGS